MAGRMFFLVLLLSFCGAACSFSYDQRIAHIEADIVDLKMQEIRLTVLEDKVHSLLPPAPEVTAPEVPFPEKVQTVAAAPSSPSADSTRPDAVTNPVQSPPSNTAKKTVLPAKQYQQALSTLESGKPKLAGELFRRFIADYPGDALTPNAAYWLGECFYASDDFTAALTAFKDVVALFPQHDKAAAALLKIGYSYEQVGEAAKARPYYEALLKEFPASPPAQLARARLGSRPSGRDL